MKEMGLIGHDIAANVQFEDWPSCNELTDQQRKTEARKMEGYGAMVDNMDPNISHLMAHLEGKGELDNTVVLFTSAHSEKSLPVLVERVNR